MKTLFIILGTVAAVLCVQAQDTIRIGSYNLLNYPGSTGTARHPYYRAGVLTMHPDILVVQEMQYQNGQANVDNFRNNVLNYYQPGLFASVPFHHDNPNSDTENSLFYKPDKVSFVGANYIATDLRDIAEYTVAFIGTNDTLKIYSLHLKASQGTTNEQQRLSEATTLRNYLNNLPPGTKFIICGDYNTYYSTEPCLVRLEESQADNDGRTKDPLNSNGTWNNNSSFSMIHTQSPRTRQFDGGSNGGMDDRFDIMLTSYSSLDANILVSSYTSYGNDGNHFNDSINRLPNTAVPDSTANGLHYASDHLPIYCDFVFQPSVPPVPPDAFELALPIDGSTSQPLTGTLRWNTSPHATKYTVYLDTVTPPQQNVSTNQPDTSYSYSGLLAGNRSYYWSVTAKNNIGDSIVATEAPWTFATLPTYTIASTSGAHGSITPIGNIVVVEGGSQNFTLIPNTGYHVDSILVDEVKVDSLASYTITNVVMDHTIRATFAINQFTITSTADAGGTVSPSDAVVDYDNDTTFTILPDAGYHIDSVFVDGIYMGRPDVYSFTNVTVNHTIHVIFTTQGPAISLSTNVAEGWNMISLPIDVINAAKNHLYPMATSDAFGYDGSGYAPSETLFVARGYWMRFLNDTSVQFVGRERLADTITVTDGWNLLGSSFDSLAVDSIETVPTGILLSKFFFYEGTYTVADELMRGKAFWVKTNAGILILKKP